MDLHNEVPDVRFWTTYDYFMAERHARALRRRRAYARLRGYWKRATGRIAHALRHAGAQPVKPQRTAA